MSEIAEYFEAKKEFDKARKEKNLASASSHGWTIHSPYHWSRDLNGYRLDYWPSTTRFQYKCKIMVGDVRGFIKNRTNIRQFGVKKNDQHPARNGAKRLYARS